MKHKLIILAMITIMPIEKPANAVLSLDNGVCTSTTCTAAPMEAITTCREGNHTNVCYKSGSGNVIRFQSCTSCPSGTERKQVSISELSNSCNTTYELVYQCCISCGTCASDIGFTATGTAGYEQQARRSCTCTGGCAVISTTYRCAAGYYGSSTNGTSGCTRCPQSGSGTYGTSAAGSKYVTSCYLPAGTSFSDTTGSGTYTENCEYSNGLTGGEIVELEPIKP
ncbi:MAG: hypothetical protein K2M34_03115 [Alphaproteobacteria bacterium]|nr:hypothetical protein [Alphaproteobacteria bacterium]